MSKISEMTTLSINSPTGLFVPVEKTGSTTNYKLDLGPMLDPTPQMFGAMGDANATGTTGTDDTAAIQAAIDYINAQGGGILYFPEGNYKVTSYLTLCKNVGIIGAGRTVSKIVTEMAGGGGASTDLSVRNGSVFYSNWASNSSTAAEIVIEDIGIICSNAANVGAAFYDNGGSFLRLRNVRVSGFKYGVVFDQSELADIDLCDFESQTVAGVWLVNVADLRAGNSSEFTNRISINRSQFNGGTTSYGILDDGGSAHAFQDNNYNGCLIHIRAAGVTGLRISGGEFESATSANILFHNLSLAGTGAGSCSAVWLGGGAEIVPTIGQSCIATTSLGNIELDSVYFGNTAAVKFTGAANANLIVAHNIVNAGGGATFDGRATNHFEVNNTGVFGNLPFSWGGTPIINGSGVLQAAGFPALTGDVTSAGGSLATALAAATVVAKVAGQALAPASVAATGAVSGTTITGTSFLVGANQVVGARDTGWSADTGTAKKTANATYTAGATLTYSAAYVQAEQTAMATRMAAVEAALQNAMQTIKALKDERFAAGSIGA